MSTVLPLLQRLHNAPELTFFLLMGLFDRFSVSTRISSDLCFRLPLALCAICIISFHVRSMRKQIWLTYIMLFPGDIVKWMLLSDYCAKLLNDAGSQCINQYCIPSFWGYEEDIVAGDPTISFSELSPAVVRTINNCTISGYPRAYARGD